MTAEIALALGRATALLLRKGDGKFRVVIGKDTRLSCYMFENALIAGLCSMGADTLMVGPLPTPGVAFITRAYRADAGIMISASHNLFYDNGIKIFTSDGFKLPDELEEQMEMMIGQNAFDKYLPLDSELGKNTRIADADGRYIEFIKATFPKKMTLKGYQIVVDCANGAAHRVAPHIFQELDAQVTILGNQPNGTNINENCGALHPQSIQRMMLEKKAHVGIALDGDGDRVIMIDEKGNIIDGDTLLAICAHDMKTHGMLQNNRVVATVMSNFGFFKCMRELEIEVIQSAVGDRYVLQEMRNHNTNLGGEQSGHMIFLDHNTTGDGLLAAIQVLGIMKKRGKTLSELAAPIKKYPQALLNVPVKIKPPLESVQNIVRAKKEVEDQLGDRGRVLIRYSGTEEVCRVMVEGEETRQVENLAAHIANVMKVELGGKV